MKKTVILMIMSFVVFTFTALKGESNLFACGGCSSGAFASEQKEETEKLTLKIEGMESDDCVKKIKAAITKVPNVKQCDVNLKEKCACVEVKKNTDHTHKDLIEAVQKAGYKVTDVVEEPKLKRD